MRQSRERHVKYKDIEVSILAITKDGEWKGLVDIVSALTLFGFQKYAQSKEGLIKFSGKYKPWEGKYTEDHIRNIIGPNIRLNEEDVEAVYNISTVKDKNMKKMWLDSQVRRHVLTMKESFNG